MNTIRVVLADDQHLVRKGLRALIDLMDGIDVVGEAGDGLEALEMLDQLNPDVLLLDIMMPEMNGIELLSVLQRRVSKVKVICLSLYDNEEYIFRTIQLGAQGYLLKTSNSDDLETAIRKVDAGEKFLASAISDQVIQSFLEGNTTGETSLDKLSNRQRQILKLVAEGNATKVIAKKLDISVKTVEMHRSTIMKTLSVKGVAEMTRYAIKHGLVTA